MVALFAVLILLGQTDLGGAAVSGAAGSPIDEFQQANLAYIALSRDTELRKVKANWLTVVKEYDDVARRHPQSALAPKAIYMKGKLYEQIYGYFFKAPDLDAAIQAYQTVAEKYPEVSIADDALYKVAKIHEARRKDSERAIAVYREIVNRYPKGDMAQQAREALNAINIETEDRATVRPKQASRPEDTPRDKEADSAGLAQVKEVRQFSDNEYTRIVIALDHSAAFETFTLPEDPQAERSQRLVMDLRNARIAPGLPHNMTIKDGILETIRISQNQKDKVRIVMDLNAHGSYKAFPLENPARIVLDVSKKPDRIVDRPEEKPLARSKPGIQRVRSHAHSQVAQDVPSIAKQLSLKVSRIVIDPGHGGKDPGAIGPGGEKEKDITLAVGKVLARRLKAEGFEVFMTRETDVFIPLEERTAFANKRKADLFVSVHVNAHADSGVRGIETYILNLTTDASSIQVAARENATTSKSLSDLQFIINDLMLTSKINESSRFATSTQKSILASLEKSGHAGKDLGVKQAPFYVLMGARMPSILVEIGFITNSTECTLLQDEAYQNNLIDGILSGINSYIANTSYAFNGRNS